MKKGLLMIAAFLFGFAAKGVAQTDGEYYLYNTESKCFLSHGDSWGTRAVVDKYGSPVLWNSTEGSLKFLDNGLCLFETDDNFFFTDNASTGFSFEEATDGYYLKSAKSGSYAMLAEGIASKLQQILLPIADQTVAAVWQLKTKAERDEMVAGYVNENYASVAKAAGLNVTVEDFLKLLAIATTTDMTSSIGTARFAGGAGDWTYTQVRGESGQPKYGTDFCELWQATGSYTQTVVGLPEGVYKVTMNGFERAAGNADCVTLGDLGYEISTSALIANGEQVALKSWYSGQTGGNNPNGTGEAIAKFSEGKYLNEVYTYVGADGQLTLTVDKHAHVGDNWMLFNNFTLTRYDIPFAPVEVSPATTETTNKLDVIILTFTEDVDVNDDLKAVLTSKQTGDKVEGAISYDYDDYTKVLITLDTPVNTAGEYQLTIPAGAIFSYEDETKAIDELTYTFNVDPDYWNPEWIVEVGANCTQEAPCQLVAGRKYNFTELYTYAQFTATETGRVYLAIAEDKYNEMSNRAEDWEYVSDMSETEDGSYWFGVEAGKTYNLCNYGFGSRVFTVTFEAGAAYEPIAFLETSPADGGMYSKSVSAEYSYTKGAVDFVFTHNVDMDALSILVVLPSKGNKEIDVTDDAMVESGTVWGVGAYFSVDLRTVIDDIKAENGLQAGDKIQLVLKNVQDANFADNKLDEDPKVELTLAATMCTSVSPSNSYGVESIPTEISLQFDANVTCTEGGKGWIIDTKSGNKQEFSIENFVCGSRPNWDGSLIYMATVTLPEVTIELTSKQFAIQLEGLVDDEGLVVSYGDEAGKFIIDYRFRDDNFNPVAVDPEDESEVTSIKTTRLTFADEVHISPEAEAPYFYVGENEVMGTLAVDPDDPKSVIITWSEEITKPGRYNITVPNAAIYDSMFDADKDDYGVADGAGYNPYLSYTYYIPADLSATTVVSVTPEPTVGWMSTPLSQLPEEVVIEFEGTVKEVVSAYSEIGGLWSAKEVTAPEDATALQSRIEDNKVILTIPAEHISTMIMGQYSITVNALGEDGKPIGYAFDEYGDYDAYADCISFSYTIEKSLELVGMTPADGSTVKQLDKVVLTFSEDIFEVDSEFSSIQLWDEMWDNCVEPTVTFKGNVATLTFDPAVTTAGYYDLVISQGYFATEEYVGNSELYLGLTIDPNHVEDLAIVSATPENGATVASLTTVELKLNKEVGYLYKSMLIPADGGDDAASASLIQSETDPTSYTLDFTFEGYIANGATLRKGVTYTMELQAYASEEAWQRDGAHETVTLTYVGGAEAFQYSDVTFEGITPAEGFVITDESQNKFTVKFSGAVEIVEDLTFINMGQGATEKFASIEANADKTEYTLTIAESLLATLRNEVYIIFAANDLEGKRVQGNNGEEEYSCFAISYKTVIGVPDLSVTPDAAVEQASLNTLSITCVEGLIPSWTAGNITLTDANGNAIALNDPEAVIPADKLEDLNYTPVEWTVSLKEELTTIGTYTLTIPAAYFNIGSTQGQVMGSKETVVVFNITAEAQSIKAVTADTEVVVYNVAGVVVANGKASEVLKGLTKGIYIVNGKKYVVK